MVILSKMPISFTFHSLKFFKVKFVIFEIIFKLNELKFDVLFCFIADEEWLLSTALLRQHIKHKHVGVILIVDIERIVRWILLIELDQFVIEQLDVVFVQNHLS